MTPRPSAITDPTPVGGTGPDDWRLAPTAHADRHQAEWPALAAVLRGSAIQSAATLYEVADRDAVIAQADYKRTAARARATTAAASIFTALLTASVPVSEWLGGAFAVGLPIALGVCAAGAGSMGAMYLFRIRTGALLERWMSRRAEAETQRLSYFQVVTAAPAPAVVPTDPPLSVLQLEYFRRYQLDVQLRYYDGRGRQHAASARKTLNWTSAGTFVSSFGAFAVSLLALQQGALVSLAALGTIGLAVTTLWTTREAANQDARNAERYRRTYQLLLALQARLDAVREAAASGDRGALDAFVTAVNEQISLEHRQWREDSVAAHEMLKPLEQALAQATDARSAPTAG